MRSISHKLGVSDLSLETYLEQVSAITSGLKEVGRNVKLTKFLPNEGKVVISRTNKPNDIIIENMRNYPLGREHEHMIRKETFVFDEDSEYANVQELIDVAAYYANTMMALTEKIYIIVVKDQKFYSKTKTVVPNIFANSNYVANVSTVVTGNAANGEGLISDDLKNDIALYSPQDDGFMI